MAYDKKQFLDLLLEYKSDESKKARRNVSLIAFVILSACFLNLHLSNMTVLGMNVSHASEIPVLVVAFIFYPFSVLVWHILACLDTRRCDSKRTIANSG